MFKEFITSQNVVLKQKQLRSSYQRVRISENAPMISRIQRRVYRVRAPLSLWHIDGNHKMDLLVSSIKVDNFFYIFGNNAFFLLAMVSLFMELSTAILTSFLIFLWRTTTSQRLLFVSLRQVWKSGGTHLV